MNKVLRSVSELAEYQETQESRFFT